MSSNCTNIYKRCRSAAGITQERASELLGVAPRTLSDYETGRTRPPDCAVSAMMDIYGCPELGYLHLQSGELGEKVLVSIRLPDSDGDDAMQLLAAIKLLKKAFRSLEKKAREKTVGADAGPLRGESGESQKSQKRIELARRVQKIALETELRAKKLELDAA